MLNKIQQYNQTAYFYLILLIAFFIPLHKKILTVFIALLFLNWIIEGFLNFIVFKKVNIRFKKFTVSPVRTNVIIFISLYLMYLIGMLYSSNFKYGWFDLEIKLSIIIFPLVFSTINPEIFNKKKYENIVKAFVFGCILGSLICLSCALWGYLQTGQQNLFYYSNFSVFHHPSYFSMYINFVSIIIISNLLYNTEKIKRINIYFNFFLLTYLFVLIFLLASRSGVISILIVYFFSILYLIIYKRKYLFSIIIIIMICLVSFYSFKYLTLTSSRIIVTKERIIDQKEIEDNNKNYSTNARLLTWESAFDIMKKHPLLGVGTGDVRDVLTKRYNEKEILPVLKRYLNVHNQFLQTFLSIGIIGFTLLSLTLILPFFKAIKEKDLLLFVFVILIILNFSVESMLEVQAGVIFYSFFSIFLLQKKAS